MLVSIVFGAIYFGIYCLAIMNAYLAVIAFALLVFVVPGFKCLLVQALSFPSIKKYMIDPYYAEHKGEDIEKRRALGLEVGDDEVWDEQEESLFTDTVSNDD